MFIVSPFARRCSSRTNQSNGRGLVLGVRNDKDPMPVRVPDRHGAGLVLRMSEVLQIKVQWICEDGARFLEADSVLLQIRVGLCRIPMKFEHAAFEPALTVKDVPSTDPAFQLPDHARPVVGKSRQLRARKL